MIISMGNIVEGEFYISCVGYGKEVKYIVGGIIEDYGKDEGVFESCMCEKVMRVNVFGYGGFDDLVNFFVFLLFFRR